MTVFKKTVSIAADHGGVELKGALVGLLKERGFSVDDKGSFTKDSVDYPDYAKLVCDDVTKGKSSFGILVCTSGIGMSIAANKIAGIRAALCHNADCAKFSRLHNNANVICMGAKYVPPALAAEMVRIFAETQFEGGRHERRVCKFTAFERLH